MAATARAARGTTSRPSVWFSVLAGLTSLVILLQGLWAGLFVPLGEGGVYTERWVDVHATGSLVALVLALATTVAAFVTARDQRVLWGGALLLTVLVAVEGWIGALVEGGSRGAAAIHIPLALLIMSITVWLPLRARQARRA